MRTAGGATSDAHGEGMDRESTRGPGQGTRYDTGPTVALTVKDLRGGWNNGVFAGDDELVEWAREMADAEEPVVVFGMEVIAGHYTPLGALAAMASYWPGRAIVTEAPDNVLDLLARDEPMVGGR